MECLWALWNLIGNEILDTFNLDLVGYLCGLQLLLHIDELVLDVTAEMALGLLQPLC